MLLTISFRSESTEPSKLEVKTHNFKHENSNSSLKADYLQPETVNFQLPAQNVQCHEVSIVKSDGEMFDTQLEETNYFDKTSLIDSGIDRIVYSFRSYCITRLDFIVYDLVAWKLTKSIHYTRKVSILNRLSIENLVLFSFLTE